MRVLFAAVIALSAALLFIVQPLLAKQILPWFGGAAGVWITALLFFQALLLAGYLYAHASIRWLAPRAQAALHLVLLAAACAALPVLADPAWKPLGAEPPAARVLAALTATAGLPFLALCTTGPLLQAWYARVFGREPYRLFALSNLGSLAGLAAYPFAVEPWLPTRLQALGWSWLFATFAAGCAVAALAQARRGGAAGAGRLAGAPWRSLALWTALAATGSMLLAAVTRHITQNIAPVPLLWVVPLALYLGSFVVAFDAPQRLRPGMLLGAACAALLAMAWWLGSLDLLVAIPVHLAGLAVLCLFCHGEIARTRPEPVRLTAYYLAIAAGGVLGTLLVSLVAPQVLVGEFELGIALALTGLLVLQRARRAGPWAAGGAALAALAACWACLSLVHGWFKDTAAAARNFYGAVRVVEWGRPVVVRALRHGPITHGGQMLLPPGFSRRPVTYFGPGTAPALVLGAGSEQPRRVGVIGLGVGTLAAYGRAGDVYRFYEIDPQVIALAQAEFSYLGQTRARVELALGDARLSLEREPPQRFDVLAIDAFAGDSVPVHLLTVEALDLYLKHLAPGGVLLYQATNRFVDIARVVRAAAAARGLASAVIRKRPTLREFEQYYFESTWVIVTADARLLERPDIAARAAPGPAVPMRPWSDDFNDLIRVLRREAR